MFTTLNHKQVAHYAGFGVAKILQFPVVIQASQWERFSDVQNSKLQRLTDVFPKLSPNINELEFLGFLWWYQLMDMPCRQARPKRSVGSPRMPSAEPD